MASMQYASGICCVTLANQSIRELNQVIELWRFHDASACVAHREAARNVPEWRSAIGKVAPMVQVRCLATGGRSSGRSLAQRTAVIVQSFSTTFLQPVSGSPWR